MVILTKDEEKDLPGCLAKLGWCDDIHVVDSGSADLTREIAEDAGASVLVNPFQSFGQQRNWALDRCDLRHPWVLFLDADEQCTPSFVEEIQEATRSAPNEGAGFYCCWKLFLEGRWLKRVGQFPNWQFRLLRRGRASFVDSGHGQKEGTVNGEIGYIREPYHHYPFERGWTHWIEKHNRYSTLEANERLMQHAKITDLFARSSAKRNVALKILMPRIPGWPAIRFFHAYVVRLGFLEGRPGFTMSLNWAIYEYFIKLKMHELQSGAPQAIVTRPAKPGLDLASPPPASVDVAPR